MQAPRPLCFIIYLCINACITLFDNSSLEYGLKSESIVPITLYFLSMIVLITWYPVTFHINFRMNFPIFLPKVLSGF